jgi:8-oxo-dGTP pyrophosphatase MutT (NUDIX family)
MRKIYVNDRKIFICSPEETGIQSDIHLNLNGSESLLQLREIVFSFEENNFVKTLTLQTNDIHTLWQSLQNIYKPMSAAGGIVFNDKGELLMIFRNEKWDLPKGKVESGEKTDDAAIREVEEECNVRKLNIQRQAATTYHTYPYKDDIVLKSTYWYIMTCNDPENISPQKEEGITAVKWMSKQDIQFAAGQSYASIISLLSGEGIL